MENSDSIEKASQAISDSLNSIDSEQEYSYFVLFNDSFSEDSLEVIKSTLIDDISTVGSDTSENIPVRACPCIDNFSNLKSIAEFSLTPLEASELLKDSRIKSVSLNLHKLSGYNDVEPCAIQQVSAIGKENWMHEKDSNLGFVYSGRTDPTDGAYTSSINIFTPGEIDQKFFDYEYNLTGKGVDIVVVDTGVDASHPEFNDSLGNSRVQQINWFTTTGVAGTQPANFYKDFDYHGTHCAGTTAGKTYGWGKDSNVYSLKIIGDTGTTVSVEKAYELILAWHKSKPINPSTGFKRPTVVSNSWAHNPLIGPIGETTWLPNSVKHNGTTYTRFVDYSSLSSLQELTGIYLAYSASVRAFGTMNNLIYGSIIKECLDEGIHVVFAAGNYSNISSKPGDIWNNNTIDITGSYIGSNNRQANYDVDTDGQLFVSRHFLHDDDRAILVGNLYSTYNTSAPYFDPALSSTRGPRVDMWAAGTSITSAGSKDSELNKEIGENFLDKDLRQSPGDAVPYPGSTDHSILKITGTSMACPQVAGIIACILEANPGWSPLKVKKVLEKTAVKNQILDLQEHGPGNYVVSSSRNLLESNNYIVRMPFIGSTKIKSTSTSPYIEMRARYSTRLQPAPNITNTRYREEIIIETRGLPDGTTLTWDISTDSTLDEPYLWINPFESKTVTIQNNTASFYITAKDLQLKGSIQDSGYIILYIKEFPNCRIKLDVALPEPSLIKTSGNKFTAEGTEQIFKWDAINIPNGTVLYYSITGNFGMYDSDYTTPRTGQLTVTNGVLGPLRIALSADGLTKTATYYEDTATTPAPDYDWLYEQHSLCIRRDSLTRGLPLYFDTITNMYTVSDA